MRSLLPENCPVLVKMRIGTGVTDRTAHKLFPRLRGFVVGRGFGFGFIVIFLFVIFFFVVIISCVYQLFADGGLRL